MKNSIKIAIIILIILIFLISILILIFNKNISNKNIEEENVEKINEEEFNISVDKNISKVTQENEFFNVSNCVQLYIDYLNDENYEAIYKVLDKNYIKSNNITVESLNGNIKKSDNNKFIPTKMNKQERDLDISIYFVYGKTVNDSYKNEEEKSYTVVIDYAQDLFSIIPNNLENEKDYEYNLNIESDTSDFYNEIIYTEFSEKEIVTKYFDYYKELALHNTKEAFKLLEEEYKNKRFNNNEEKYEKYVKDINIENIFLSQYMCNIYNNYTEYVCIDKNGNYYIFNETAPMEFTLKLDTYTIDVPEFIERYNKGNEQIKVGMNIEKIMQALNNKDYNYIYGKLDESFKQNNFNTIDKFETYMKDNFFEINKAEYEKFSKEGEIYIYQLKIKESEEENANSKDVTVIMKLLEDRNFVMSFNVN